jgi:hypothetical protein
MGETIYTAPEPEARDGRSAGVAGVQELQEFRSCRSSEVAGVQKLENETGACRALALALTVRGKRRERRKRREVRNGEQGCRFRT